MNTHFIFMLLLNYLFMSFFLFFPFFTLKIYNSHKLLTSIFLIQFIPLFLRLYFHSFVIVKLIPYFFHPPSFSIQFLFLFLISPFLLFLFYIIQHISFPLTVNVQKVPSYYSSNYLYFSVIYIFLYATVYNSLNYWLTYLNSSALSLNRLSFSFYAN